MIKEFRKYMKKKGLEVNTEKSKIIRFGKRIMMKEKREWKWEKREIKDVNKYKYLGFTFQRNGKVSTRKRKSKESKKSNEGSMGDREKMV